MMTKDSATVEQFMEWVGDAKVMIAINSYEVCEKIMGVEIPFAEVHYDKNKKEITFSSKDKASLTLKTDSIERIDKLSERDTCYSIRMKVYNINFSVLRR